MSTSHPPVERLKPAKARELAGLTPDELRLRVPCALSSVYRIEGSGKWPTQAALRTAYQAALRAAIAAKVATRATA